jgi:hypothetical protein
MLDRPGDLQIGEYICFERGARVVGLIAEQPVLSYSFDPMADLTVYGDMVGDLTGLDYLAWLESVGAYEPHAVPKRCDMGALAVLLDSFAAVNADLPATERQRLLASLSGPGRYAPPRLEGAIMQALVPLSIGREAMPQGFPQLDPRLTQMFGVDLWPHFRQFSPQYLAGDGWTGFFYFVTRPNVHAAWRVTSMGTGP